MMKLLKPSRGQGEGGREEEGIRASLFFLFFLSFSLSFVSEYENALRESRAERWQRWSERWLSRPRGGGNSSALLGGRWG